MKQITLILCFLFTPLFISAQSVPNVFQNGQVIDATKFNENFQIVSSGIRKGTVDCNAGESINEKLKEYNHLKISGICTENVLIDFQKRSSGIPGSNWDNSTGVQHYVALIGVNNSSLDGIKAQDPNEKVIKVNGPVTVLVEGLIISGGDDGIKGYWGALVGVRNSHIENNSNNGFVIERGMGAVLDSTISNNHNGIVALYGSRLYVDNSTIENHEGAGIGIWLGANGLIGNRPENDENGNKDFTRPRGNIITGSRTGVSVADTSFARLIGNTITCYINQGIWASESSTLDLGVNHDRADLTDTTNPLNYSHSNYATNKLTYGNLIDGAACSGVDREDWQNGVDVRESTALRMYRNVIKNNSAHGVRAEAQSSIVLGGGNEIRDNDDNGFDLSGSTLNQWDWDQEHEPSVVESNGRDAFNLNYSELNLRGGWVWDDDSNSVTSKTHKFMISDHRRGIAAHRNSSVTLQRVEIKDNTETGIDLYDGSNLNIWFDRTNEDESDGVVISGNGIATDSNNHRAGLRINNGSTANVDFVKIIGNGRGIEVRDNSILKGGWSASESSALTYGIIIKDNKREGLRIQNNSTAHVDYVQVENNAVDEVTDHGNTWRDDAIEVRDSSVLDMDRSRIANNKDSILRVSGKSYAHFYDIEIDANAGDTAIRVDSSELEISGANLDDDDADVYPNPVVISGHETGIRASNGSRLELQRVEVNSNTHRGIQVSENSILNVWSGGLVLKQNGLDHDGWDGYGPALEIERNSSATVDRLTVEGNGRGIRVTRGSTLSGGWNGDVSQEDYGITIVDNVKWGIEVQDNSNLDIAKVKVSGNGETPNIDTDDNDIHYETAIRISDGSSASINEGIIKNNFGGGLSLYHNAQLDLYNLTVDSNGLSEGTYGVNGGINIADNAHLNLNLVTISNNGNSGLQVEGNSKAHLNETTVSGNGNGTDWVSAIRVTKNSQISLNDSTVITPKGNGIDINYWSKADVSNSSIECLDPDDNSRPYAFNLWKSKLSINHDSSIDQNTISLKMAGHAIWASGDSEVSINQPLTITTTGGSTYEQINIEEGSEMYFNDLQTQFILEKVTAETESKISMQANSNINLNLIHLKDGSQLELRGSNKNWIIDDVYCSNPTTTNGVSVFRLNAIFLNGFDNSSIENINQNCGVVP